MKNEPTPLVLDLNEVGAGDVELVGGKCASLGELCRALAPKGVRAVDGFATTREAYRLLLESDGLGKRLRELMHGRTVISVAHRLSTVRHFDRIVVLQAGGVVEDGAPEELLRRRGVYQKMVQGEIARLMPVARAA